MGKTKKLAEELTEKERPLGPLEHPRPVSNEPKPVVDSTPPVTQIHVKGLTDELYDALKKYLEARPHGEVKGLVAALEQTAGPLTFDVTLNVSYGTK